MSGWPPRMRSCSEPSSFPGKQSNLTQSDPTIYTVCMYVVNNQHVVYLCTYNLIVRHSLLRKLDIYANIYIHTYMHTYIYSTRNFNCFNCPIIFPQVKKGIIFFHMTDLEILTLYIYTYMYILYIHTFLVTEIYTSCVIWATIHWTSPMIIKKKKMRMKIAVDLWNCHRLSVSTFAKP